MKEAISASEYDSASSRTQAPQAGAALKSTSSGLRVVLASDKPASASLFQFTAMTSILLISSDLTCGPAAGPPQE
jgi:hypothetical protein